MLIEYNLFRIKFVKPDQISFMHDDFTPQELFLKSLDEKPSLTMWNKVVWHIGNLRDFDSECGYFAIGKTTKSLLEKFDKLTGNFIEEEHETSPYTHVVYDSKIGLIAIAKKVKLAPTVRGIANKLVKILNETQIVKNNKITVEVKQIDNPEVFISMLHSAYAVKKFTAHFGGPNPFDADEYFQKPMSQYLNKTGGFKGKTIIEGDNLKPDVIEDVTQSTASIGNKASASIQESEGSKVKTIHLRGDAISFDINENENTIENIISVMRQLYSKVRGK